MTTGDILRQGSNYICTTFLKAFIGEYDVVEPGDLIDQNQNDNECHLAAKFELFTLQLSQEKMP